MSHSRDQYYMQYALRLARRGLGRVWPNPSVGCVIVKDGHIIAAARTADGGRPHAETIALEKAGAQAKGADVYVSLEPCAHEGKTPPCVEALLAAEIKRVFVACEDPDPRVSGEGIRILKINHIDVETGLLEKQARALNEGFINRVTKHRPLITLKLATSADGKIAKAKGARTQITGEVANRRVHLERAMHDAILVGVETVLVDNPLLTTRIRGYTHESARIVLDTDLRTPLDSKLVKTANECPLWVFHNSGNKAKQEKLEQGRVRLFEVDPKNLEAVVTALGSEGITRLLVEGGAKVHTSFLNAGLCDRFLHFKGQEKLGAGAVDALDGLNIDEIGRVGALQKLETCALGQDLLEIYGHSA